ncbi:pleckstrin-2-like isoform X2 [Haliotis rufescens]|uniref:pleckstrin-2-like isoform X2 n=1 Tax=Haliotis rufescens TaxID=6454 RepID=UPI001EB07BCF|nr:pleckstrin-2-like isoform X2 [Haliotis rufescens]
MDKENYSLRSGYLLSQVPNNKWKARWFILSEDELTCHRQRRKSLVLSTINLTGCSIFCPCNDKPEVSPQCLFKLSTPEGEELYFQAAGADDRDGWAHAIGAVIRSQSTSKQISYNKMTFQNFRAYANVSEIIGAIQDPDAGVNTSAHLRGGEVYKNCFKGSDVVDWLMRWSIVRNRENGSAMAQTLLKLGHLQEVDLHDGSSGVSPKFNDGEKLYRFTSINLGIKRNSFYDSTDEDSSSSDDDEDEGEREEVKVEKVKKGKLVKESFLMKKKNLRKGWRLVRATLRENPSSLHYHKASYTEGCENQINSKMMSLDNCVVTETVKPATTRGMGTKAKSVRYRLCVKDRKGKCVTLQTKDEQEKFEWLTVLQQLTVSPKPQTDDRGPE